MIKLRSKINPSQARRLRFLRREPALFSLSLCSRSQLRRILSVDSKWDHFPHWDPSPNESQSPYYYLIHFILLMWFPSPFSFYPHHTISSFYCTIRFLTTRPSFPLNRHDFRCVSCHYRRFLWLKAVARPCHSVPFPSTVTFLYPISPSSVSLSYLYVNTRILSSNALIPW